MPHTSDKRLGRYSKCFDMFTLDKCWNSYDWWMIHFNKRQGEETPVSFVGSLFDIVSHESVFNPDIKWVYVCVLWITFASRVFQLLLCPSIEEWMTEKYLSYLLRSSSSSFVLRSLCREYGFVFPLVNHKSMFIIEFIVFMFFSCKSLISNWKSSIGLTHTEKKCFCLLHYEDLSSRWFLYTGGECPVFLRIIPFASVFSRTVIALSFFHDRRRDSMFFSFTTVLYFAEDICHSMNGNIVCHTLHVSCCCLITHAKFKFYWGYPFSFTSDQQKLVNYLPILTQNTFEFQLFLSKIEVHAIEGVRTKSRI